MTKLASLVFGPVKFRENEEHLEFQFKFLSIVMIGGALLTALFIVGNAANVNPMNNPHINSMQVFTLSTFLLWLLLRGKKQRFTWVAWSYLLLCMLEYLSALVYVSTDELRVFWYIVNVPGVFILLGKRIGWVVTLLSLAIVLAANSHLEAPFSPNAIATFTLGMLYFALFFHFYSDRSISYFVRMRESNEKLRYMATHDTLTGVLNARAYYEISERLIRVANRDGSSYSVMFVDLDHFKSVNDTYGHAAGDIVLKTVAECLSKNIRKSDSLGRIGGEEFSIFLPNTDMNGAVELAETIRRSVESLMPDIGSQRLKITASIGVARNEHGNQSMKDIQQQADQAMYEAKAKGRNRVSSFHGMQTEGAAIAI